MDIQLFSFYMQAPNFLVIHKWTILLFFHMNALNFGISINGIIFCPFSWSCLLTKVTPFALSREQTIFLWLLIYLTTFLRHECTHFILLSLIIYSSVAWILLNIWIIYTKEYISFFLMNALKTMGLSKKMTISTKYSSECMYACGLFIQWHTLVVYTWTNWNMGIINTWKSLFSASWKALELITFCSFTQMHSSL